MLRRHLFVIVETFCICVCVCIEAAEQRGRYRRADSRLAHRPGVERRARRIVKLIKIDPSPPPATSYSV